MEGQMITTNGVLLSALISTNITIMIVLVRFASGRTANLELGFGAF